MAMIDWEGVTVSDEPYVRKTTEGLEFNRTAEEVAAAAARRGKSVVYPRENELFVDLDSPEARADFEENARFFSKLGVVFDYALRPSARAGHWHAVVTLADGAPVTTWQRLALQAALGDDHKRHVISCARALRGEEAAASVFFETLEEP